MKARFNGRNEPEHTTSFNIYIDFSQDTLFLSDRFISFEADCRDLRYCSETEPEEMNLQLLINVLPYSVIKRIAYLMLTTISEPVLGWSPYGGKHLELFTALKHLHLHSHPGHPAHYVRTRRAIEWHVRKVLESRDSEVPRISVFLSASNDQASLAWMYMATCQLNVMEFTRSSGDSGRTWGFQGRRSRWIL